MMVLPTVKMMVVALPVLPRPVQAPLLTQDVAKSAFSQEFFLAIDILPRCQGKQLSSL
jgi:hypothetical protein